MRDQFLQFSPPAVGQDEIREVVDTLESGWLTTGPKTAKFEADFARAFDAPAALALNSCTAAMHAALVALGVGPGDEVITTCWTFAATANVIEHVGAQPVLVDIQPDTLNIDPDRVAAAMTTRTKVVIAVHYAGHPADLDSLRALCDARQVVLLEDAAHAVGAQYRGRWIGSGDNPTAFSFYATKNLTTGEGGMLCGDEGLLRLARLLSLHGMSREAWQRYAEGGKWHYDVVAPGFKCNMTDLQAGIGLAQLKRFASLQRRRAEIAGAYQEAFATNDALELPACRKDVQHAWHLFPLRLRPDRLSIGRDEFVAELGRRNIGASVHFIPLHLHSYYRKRLRSRPEDFPVALDAYHRILSIPLSPALSDQDVADVVEAVNDVTSSYLSRRGVA